MGNYAGQAPYKLNDEVGIKKDIHILILGLFFNPHLP